MVPPVQRLHHRLADEPVVYERRNCGTTLDTHQDSCPTCGADDPVRYDLE